MEKEKKNFPIKALLLYALTALAAAVFPVFFLYGQNAAEADPAVALRCVALFALEGLAAYLLGLLLTRSAPKGALAAGVVLVLTNNFKFIETMVRSWSSALKYWHALFLCILAAGHAVWLIRRFCKEELAKTLASVLALVMGGLCVMNLCMSVPGFLAYQDMAGAKKISVDISENADAELPNFYYIIFDEYGGYDATEKYYGKDGGGDIAFFRELGFNVSESSYSGTWHTIFETANLFHMDYVALPDRSSVTETNKLRRNAPFFQLLQEKGYSILGVGAEATDTYGLPSAYETQAGQAETVEGKTFRDLLIDNTVFYPSLLRQDIYAKRREEDIKSLEFFLNTDTGQRGQFYLLHIECPHMPFIFDAQGGALNPADSANWADKEIYLGQREYMTQWMKRIAQSLIERDPDSIIIFQSDHGFRGNGSEQASVPKEYGCNILNNVYYRGRELDVEGKTGINTLRTVLNKLFGMDYKMLTPPEGVFSK